MNSSTQVSNCCNAPFHSISSDEGTGYYVCDKCDNACDPATPQTMPEGRELRNTIGEILVRNNLRTDQVAINEIVSLLLLAKSQERERIYDLILDQIQEHPMEQLLFTILESLEQKDEEGA